MTEEEQIKAAIVLSLKDQAPKGDTKYKPRVFNTLKRTGKLDQYREYYSLFQILRTENVYIALLFILYYISFYDTAIIIVFTKFIVVSTQGFPRPLPPLLLHPIL